MTVWPSAASLRNLWERVGFEYNRKRAGLAALAVQYLKHQESARKERSEIAAEIAATVGVDRSPTRLTERYAAQGINRRFVERAARLREARLVFTLPQVLPKRVQFIGSPFRGEPQTKHLRPHPHPDSRVRAA